MSGWIKLPKDFLEWQWWHSGNHVRLFLWLYIKAEVQDRRRGTYIVRRGSVLTSWGEMQAAVGLSRGTLDRILKDFKNAGVCITKADCHKTIVTLCKYDEYNKDDSNLWTTNGLQTDYKRTAPPIINKNGEYEKYIYSAREESDGIVTDADCQAWLRRYNDIARQRGFQPCSGITTKRRLYITQRVREKGRGSVDVMFERLAESDYFFADGSHGFRGDFTNLWTADVYTKVIEGFYIPMRKKPDHQPQKAVPSVFDNVPEQQPQPTEEERLENCRRRYLDMIALCEENPKSSSYTVLRMAYQNGDLQKLGISWVPNQN